MRRRLVPRCTCSWPVDCDGDGTLRCEPPCGGDACWCFCGGYETCPGCDECDRAYDEDRDDWQDEGVVD